EEWMRKERRGEERRGKERRGEERRGEERRGEFRADFQVLLLIYKALHGLAPTYPSNLVLVPRISISLIPMVLIQQLSDLS
ncbi:hypothetical protein, partial [Escherichia coli]|uniref:hypothetical protein n=1 Tax=Escherichia coli TaxID=562 RepID=UPI001F2D0F7C